jgi:hypothetical protein
MSRADVRESHLKTLPNFYLYVDEFQSFANKSFADILSEARKYKLNLTIAHQYIEQMEEEVRAAVFGNVGTMITFRVGSYDAEILEKEFAPQFTAEDLVNLGIYQVYLKLMIDGVSSSPFSAVTIPPLEKKNALPFETVVEASRKNYSNKREVVESEIKAWHQPIVLSTEKEKKKEEKRADEIKKEEVKQEKPREIIDLKNSALPVPPISPKPKEINEKPFAKAFSEAGISNVKPIDSPKVNLPPTQNNETKEVSLEQIKKEKDNKDVREKNISDLKKALSAVLDSSKQSAKQPDKPLENSTSSMHSIPNPFLVHPQNDGKSIVGKNVQEKEEVSEEVSPDVLKEVLSLRKDDINNKQ